VANTLTPSEIEALGSPLAVHAEVHAELRSTQERARELARDGAPHGTIVVAEVQRGGRGRLGRAWGSPSGGIWTSVLLRPPWNAALAARLTQTAAVAVARALRSIGVEAEIKWPNDLLVGDRKVCGILAESSLENVPVRAKRVGPAGNDLKLDFVVLGIGLNANLDPEDLAVPDRGVTTVRAELGHDVPRLELLAAILAELEEQLDRIEDFEAVLNDWRALNCTLGHRVRVQRFGEVLEGLAIDLNPDGALVLQTPRGTHELYEGEVERLRRRG
jgi:BirA family transcriptional regulator, biotin operon repressor / biotin---[acetyl-CoA-carboxylase] ligase